jgi:hypothetical protein
MDGHRFDALTRAFSRATTRRASLGGIAAAVIALWSGARAGAAQLGYLGPGDACYDDDQCASSDTTLLVCADNGFDYDGDLNCCAFEGGFCSFDEGCCGALVCYGGICGGLAPSGTGAGSISVQGLLCPAPDSPLEACQYTDEIFASDFILTGPGGTTLSLANGTSHAVSHVWEGLPYGAYYFQAFGTTPMGYELDHFAGTTIVDAGVEAVVIDDSAPYASIDLVFAPSG